MKLALITDAWFPQVNGVVTTLAELVRQITEMGHQVEVIHPGQFRTMPCPGYAGIELALRPRRALRAMLDAAQPDAIHIATEAPLGLAARAYCKRRNLPFTTSFHTRFAEYVQMRTGLPLSWGYAFLRWFHNGGERMMTATPGLVEELKSRGFKNPVLWARGVDTELFRPRAKDFLDVPRPVLLYTGRVAVEKNIEAFLRLETPGTKVVVGDGPQREELERQYPAVRFVGYQHGEALARHMAAADVFVFPSLTDTFGLVMLEALACGIPVAAFPVQGPQDVILDRRVGCLDEDLSRAIDTALGLDSADCREYALRYSWEDCAKLFESHLAPIPKTAAPAKTMAWWQRYS